MLPRAVDLCQSNMCTLNLSILTLFVYVFIEIQSNKRMFRRQFQKPDKAFSFNCSSADCDEFFTRQQDPLFSFTVHCENFVVNQKQNMFQRPSCLKELVHSFYLCIYRIIDALGQLIWRARKKLNLLSAALQTTNSSELSRCIHNSTYTR